MRCNRWRRLSENEAREVDEVRFGDLLVNFVRHEVRLRGEFIRLTPKEFKVLEILIMEPGRAFSRLELLEQAFGYDYDGLERTVDVHVMNLRRKIEANLEQPIYVQTVYGIGYKFAFAGGNDVQ